MKVFANGRIALFAGVMLLIGARAWAQVPRVPDPSEFRVRLGPMFLNPTISLTNAGIDTNVFNEPTSENPKRDFTMTVTPRTNLWLRMGRTWVTGNVREDFVWYREYASERSVNSSYGGGWVVPLTRVAFAVTGAWVHTRERPGFEIDVRSRRNEADVSGAAEIRVLSKTLFGVRGLRRTIDFDRDAIFLGASLHDELNRTETTGSATIRHELSPLTTLTLDVSRSQDRFEFAPLRDADSASIGLALGFDPFALITGNARFGFRDFKPLSSDLPGYRGATAAVELAYVALESTRFSVQATRDVQYSFDINQPYYLLTGVAGSIGQQLYGPLDVEGRIGAQRLAYTDREGASAELSDRTDRLRTYGFGVGYRMGRGLRIGFNVDQQKRESEVELRQYEGRRYGTAITFGF